LAGRSRRYTSSDAAQRLRSIHFIASVVTLIGLLLFALAIGLRR